MPTTAAGAWLYQLEERPDGEVLLRYAHPNDPHPVEVLSKARLAHLGDDLVVRWERVVAVHVLGRAA